MNPTEKWNLRQVSDVISMTIDESSTQLNHKFYQEINLLT